MIFDLKKKTLVVRWRKFVLSLWCWGLGPIETVYSVYCTETFIFIANILPTVYPVASRSHDSILLRKFIHVAIFKKSIEIWFSCKRSQMIKSSKSQSGYQKIWSNTNWFRNFLKLWKLLLISYYNFFCIKRSITFKLMRN